MPTGSVIARSRIAAVTFATGADNIGVFTRLFRSLGLAGALGTSVGFLALVGVWCALGALPGTHGAVGTVLGRVVTGRCRWCSW